MTSGAIDELIIGDLIYGIEFIIYYILVGKSIAVPSSPVGEQNISTLSLTKKVSNTFAKF